MKTERLYEVAVYGTLMTGCVNYSFAADAVARERCIIKGTLYDTRCGFPAFVPDGKRWVGAELLLVKQDTMDRMDGLEGYPVFYDRKTIKAYTEKRGWQDAYVYVMNRLPKRATEMSASWTERNDEDLIRKAEQETETVGNGEPKTMFNAE